MDDYPEQNYGSTLAFSIVRSEFWDQDSTIVRTFDKISANLSQYGCWRCIFHETKVGDAINLRLSLTWMPSPDPFVPTSPTSETGEDKTVLNPAQELISRIRSIKIRSDSTLSELLVAQIDSGCLLKGEFITVRLQPARVLRNNRYKFRIGFYTQDISRSRFLEYPIFTSFLDLDSAFEPEKYRPNEAPDITFVFPNTGPRGTYTAVQAHSSAVKQSHYFAQRVSEVTAERERRGLGYHGIHCKITEFSPAVFRVMLQYLYTGRLRIKNPSKEAEKRVAASVIPSIKVEPSGTGLYCGRVAEEGAPGKDCRQPETVYFEDLYRVAERYELTTLRALSLKAMQCNLNMSIAVAMLAKWPQTPAEIEQGSSQAQIQMGGDPLEKEQYFAKIQMDLVKDIVAEYIEFFAMEATNLTMDAPTSEGGLSVRERLQIIRYIGESVVNNIGRLWE